MWLIATDGIAWSVCLSVCLSVTTMSLAKAAEPIVMLFGMLTWMGPRNHILDKVFIATRERQFWGRKGTSPRHARTCPALDTLKATQQGAAPVRCGCRLGVLDGVHIGATWRIRLNRPCAAAMRPVVRLLWPVVVIIIIIIAVAFCALTLLTGRHEQCRMRKT